MHKDIYRGEVIIFDGRLMTLTSHSSLFLFRLETWPPTFMTHSSRTSALHTWARLYIYVCVYIYTFFRAILFKTKNEGCCVSLRKMRKIGRLFILLNARDSSILSRCYIFLRASSICAIIALRFNSFRGNGYFEIQTRARIIFSIIIIIGICIYIKS